MEFVDQEKKTLKVLDWVIIAVYFLGCIIVGLWVSVKHLLCMSNAGV